MKNAIKKISAIALAFTILGVGTGVSKAISKNDSTFTASAAGPYRYVSQWVTATIEIVHVYNPLGVECGSYTVYHG